MISVLMPVRNVPPRFLDRAVASILAQTEGDFEFLIVDDGSADGAHERLQSWHRRDERIRILANPIRGVTHALNHGLAHCRGKLVARMDGDDVAEPTRFAEQAAYLNRHPGCVAVGSDLLLIDPDDRPLTRVRQAREHDEIVQMMLGGLNGVIGHPSVMMRLGSIRRVGGYDPTYPHSQDLDLFLRLANDGALANLPRPLLRHRQHLSAVSVTRLDLQERCKEEIVNLARARRGLPPLCPPRSRMQASTAGLSYLRWARMAWQGGRWAAAARYGLAALARFPSEVPAWWSFARSLQRRRYQAKARAA